MAYLPAGDRYAALVPATGRLLRLDAEGRADTPLDLPDPPSGSYIWADLAAGPDGSLHALDLRGPILARLDAAGGMTTQAADLNARRIALRGDGLRLLLGRDGWVRGVDATGQGQLAFDASRPDLNPGSRPADLAVDAAGDVYVVDRVTESVTRFTWDPDAEPSMPPDAEPSCQAEGDKVAAPAEIQLGETVAITLRAGGSCEGSVATVPLDILLLIDRSGSMNGEALATAREAALEFISATDLASARIGLVSFANQARLDAPLTHEAWQLRQALGNIKASGGTDIAAALASANDVIAREGRLSARWIFILLSDGGSEHAPAIAQAERARAGGIEVFTIGIEADAVLMRAIAADAAHYFASSRLRELFDVFATIARRIEAPALFQRIDLVDQLPDDMDYVADSAEPPPFAIDPGPPVSLRWRLEGLPAEGALLRYRLRPRQPGLRPTNILAWADFVDGFGRPGRLNFPVPEVRVIGPTATPSASPSAGTLPPPTPSRRPTSAPGPSPSPQALFLPLLLRERCRPGARHADVALVIDSSGSMQGAKLAAAKAAALQLVDLLDLPADQAAVLAFDQEARRLAPLGSSRAGIAAALAGLDSRVGTRIDRGIAAALAELLGPRARPGNTPTLVLLSDGAQSESPELALARAAEARALGLQVHAIGLGADIDRAILVALAGAPQRAYLALGPEDLGAIYRSVAGRIPCPAGDFWAGR
jgi:Mg-chelatase subunit ChlD